MAGIVDIYNMALGHLGVTTTVSSPTEPSKERKTMERFYDTALKAVIRDKNWPFTTRIKAVSLIEEDPNDEWDYSYRYPTDCLFVRRVLPGTARNNAARIPFRIISDDAGRLVLTDQSEAEIEYSTDISDPTKFPPDFALALSLRLAAYAAPSLTRGDRTSLGDRAIKLYAIELGLAASNSMNEGQQDEMPDSEFVRERGG